MSGSSKLALSEVSMRLKSKKGDSYLKEVADEFKAEHLMDEGSAEDNAQSSDKDIKVDNIGC